MIHFIKHIDIEGPDTLEVFFSQKGFQTKTVELHNGDTFPVDFNDIDAVISLGGPMNAYEEDKYPFLKDENSFIKKVLSQKIPFIGICLGSQLLAKACEVRIGKSPVKEIGFYEVEITAQGQSDPLLLGLGDCIDAYQWHEDMSELPSDFQLLASSKGCPHQAFKVGDCAYGLQFHIEVTEPTIQKWCETYFTKNKSSNEYDKQVMIDDYRQKNVQFHKTADTIYNNFLKIIYNYNKRSFV